jgi:hypothetical protein
MNNIISYEKYIIDVRKNIYWKDDIQPYFPLEKNLFKVNSIKYDNILLRHDLENSIKNSSWISKGDKSGNWQSITLKGYNGDEQAFLKKTYLGEGENNRYKYTKCMENCNYFKQILESIPTEIYLVRLLKISGNSKLYYHTDEFVFTEKEKIIRCHLPIISHPDITFAIGYPKKEPVKGSSIWEALTYYEKHLEENYLWYTNVNTLHNVYNKTTKERIHLVIDMKPTQKLIKILNKKY